MDFARVEREETPVLFVRAGDSVEQIREAWRRLEERVELRGRRFFGSCDESTGEYRACVVEQAGDVPEELGLERGALAGGRYVRLRLRGEPPELYERIPRGFEELFAAAAHDATRPSLEHYRRRDEVDLLLPVR